MKIPETMRVYPLEAKDISEEQMAVVFAMTSRSPDAFDEIAKRVSEERAADFHERWVLDYGHASVAEHAVVHLAVENISRLACDELESNRLGSYTEKSSRYQVIRQGDFHTPSELEAKPALQDEYHDTCMELFRTYHELIPETMARLARKHAKREGESTNGYELRLRRIATDACRGMLPAATLTNVGMTANARIMEHAISKLLSAELEESIRLGTILREQGRTITPTLIKYAEQNPYLKQMQQPRGRRPNLTPQRAAKVSGACTPGAKLLAWTPAAQETLATALMYRESQDSWEEIENRVKAAGKESTEATVTAALTEMEDHDPAPRECELVRYSFEFTMDYGALREFRRHRMQSNISKTLTTGLGINIPSVITDNDLEKPFLNACTKAEALFAKLQDEEPTVAQYAVTHAHLQRIITEMNLRQCYHLFRLRTSERSHESIRGPVKMAMEAVNAVHPGFLAGLHTSN